MRLFFRSTFEIFRQAGSVLRGLHAYVYGRWTPFYIRALTSIPPNSTRSRAGAWIVERWHAKVLTREHARDIVRLDRAIDRRNLEQIIPFRAARDLVLDGPPDIVAYECGCRQRLKKHCEPTQVCLVIGKPITDFILDHHPKAARRLTSEEAARLLREEHERGHVHTAWFKDAMGGRMYAICNCCSCCCAGLRTMNHGTPLIISSGYVVEVDGDACALCGDCVSACAFGALRQAEAVIVSDSARCMGCGVCVSRCTTGAMRMVRDPSKPAPLDVHALLAGANGEQPSKGSRR